MILNWNSQNNFLIEPNAFGIGAERIINLKLNKMQRISDKSRDALYEAVAEEVTQARIKIEKLNIEDKFIKEQIDKIMFGLACGAPQKALDCFMYEKER